MISIDLLKFVNYTKGLFTLNEFTSFLKDDLLHKEWVFIRSNKKEQLLKKYFNFLKSELDKDALLLNKYR